jgi:hypothetical protein
MKKKEEEKKKKKKKKKKKMMMMMMMTATTTMDWICSSERVHEKYLENFYEQEKTVHLKNHMGMEHNFARSPH